MAQQSRYIEDGGATAARLDFLFDVLQADGISVTANDRAAAISLLARGNTEEAPVRRTAFRLSVLLASDEVEQALIQRTVEPILTGGSGKVVLTSEEKLVARAGRAASAKAGVSQLSRVLVFVLILCLSIGIAFISQPQNIKLEQTSLTIPETSAPFEARPMNRETLFSTQSIPHPMRPYVVAGLTALPALFFLTLLAAWWRQRVIWFERSRGRLDRVQARLSTNPQFTVDVVADRELKETGMSLARGSPEVSSRLDVIATIRATAHRAGGLQLVYERRRQGRSKYVFLIERHTAQDHMARLADLVIDQFENLGVQAERYYYFGDPRSLISSGRHPRSISLEELSAHQSEDKLVLIGATGGFFHPLRGELHEWVRTLTNNEQLMHLSTNPVRPLDASRRWSLSELELLENGISLATASKSGLALYGETISRTGVPEGLLEGVGTPRVRKLPIRPIGHTPDLSVFKDRDETWCPEMVVIPAGRFMMGSPETDEEAFLREKPQHEVVIEKRFAIGRYPVTVAEYLAGVDAGGCPPPEWLEPGSDFNIETGSDGHYKRLGSALSDGRHPIVGISWNDAQAYIRWLNGEVGGNEHGPYRLPSESEWEYAARARTTTQYPWGDIWDKTKANGADGGPGKTTEVRTYPANSWGLFDMHGNVREWCMDHFADDYNDVPRDGTPHIAEDVSSLRVLRGGSWGNDPWSLRSAGRYGDDPGGRYVITGFRLSRTLTS